MKEPKLKTKIIIETTRRHRIDINGELIREMLRQKYQFVVPKDATIQLVVPGGGDWSNTAIDIDDNHPISVEWTAKTTEAKNGET